MEWIKHKTGSHDDPDISDAMDMFGPAGYSTFFILLEVYGEEFNHLNDEGFLTLSKTFLRRKVRISVTKLQNILRFYSERQRILSKIGKNRISYSVPQFIEIASNWVRRQAARPTEGLQRAYVAPTAREEEEEEEEDKRKKKKKEKAWLKDFETWWNIWPRKVKKQAAQKAFIKSCKEKTMPDIDALLNITKKHIAVYEERNDPQYTPHPATWLNGQQWNDILEVEDAFDRLREKYKDADDVVQA